MLARIEYALRETWASFRRNFTLTLAAVLTSAIALLLVGATFLIQRAFENLLVQWRGDVAMIVFVRSDASPEQVALIDSTLRAAPSVIDVEKIRYLDKTESYAEAQRIFAGDPVTLPFMLEGLLQGLIGGVVSCFGVWALNSAWTSGVATFKPGTGISSLVVPSGYLSGVVVILLALGALVGAIGSAIAASRFLDV
ncbi:MAG: hypothetical protein EBX76_01660 [Acidimicrobiia bacterium]|nr:hypothetical protein [Acidimicrobiia bacterium]